MQRVRGMKKLTELNICGYKTLAGVDEQWDAGVVVEVLAFNNTIKKNLMFIIQISL